MKKVIAFLCTLVLTLSMTATLYAKPSVSVSGIVTGVKEAFDADGNVIEVKIDAVPASYTGRLDEIRSDEALRRLAGDAYVKGMQLVDAKYVTMPEGTRFPVTVTFTATGVTRNSRVVVLYYDEAAGKWISVECKAGDGTITAVLPGAGLVAFVIDGSTLSGSPDTGDTAGADILPTVLTAAIALTGVVMILYARKKKA